MSGRLGRQLLQQLKRSSSREARNNAVWSHVKSEMRKGEVGKEEILKEYIHYLCSSSTHRELLSQYQGRGERSVEETANLVGLKLPNKES